jgi:hypothetical protein
MNTTTTPTTAAAAAAAAGAAAAVTKALQSAKETYTCVAFQQQQHNHNMT